MDLKEIKELIKLLDKSTLNEIEIENDEYSIRLAKNNVTQVVSQVAPQVVTSAPLLPQNQSSQNELDKATNSEDTNYTEIKSPMVGTFYSSPSPDSAAFVKIGDSISEGDPLCIIEAMKLMNELKSEHSGKIVKVLVQNSEPVEYNQVLFHIE